MAETRGNKSAFRGSRVCPNPALAFQHSRGRGQREGAGSPHRPPIAPCYRAGLREGAEEARGSPAPRSAPLSRSAGRWAPSPTARAGVTCTRLPLSGRSGRGAERSGRRGRGGPWPPPPAILSRRPLPGEGAVGQASTLPSGSGARRPRAPRCLPQYPDSAVLLPTGEAHRHGGGMGGAPPPFSEVTGALPSWAPVVSVP